MRFFLVDAAGCECESNTNTGFARADIEERGVEKSNIYSRKVRAFSIVCKYNKCKSFNWSRVTYTTMVESIRMPVICPVNSVFGETLFRLQHISQRPLTLEASPGKRQDIPKIAMGIKVSGERRCPEQPFKACPSPRSTPGLASGMIQACFGSCRKNEQSGAWANPCGIFRQRLESYDTCREKIDGVSS